MMFSFPKHHLVGERIFITFFFHTRLVEWVFLITGKKMYTLKVPKEQVSDLWRARQFLGRGPIAAQIKNAVNDYLKQVEKEIGAPIADIAEVIQQHEQESARE
ncbi:hypothetical protein KGQ34_01320 [Patescibacteria group bacterium]|nr:hypothetical protein [Patescibacteria group bacterium]